jgi:hypothetical protein
MSLAAESRSSGPPLLRSRGRCGEEGRHGNAEGGGEFAEVNEGGIALATLNAADVIAVQMSEVRQFFLSEAGCVTKGTYARPESFTDVGRHGRMVVLFGGTVYTLSV